MKGIFVMPPYQHQFVCLASSKKHGGRCVAGKIWGGPSHGTWIRPVSNRQNDSISDFERTYANGQVLQHLDLASVTFANVQNHPYQIENHVICHPPQWTSERRLGLEDIALLEDRPHDLWGLGQRSGHGLNDRIHSSGLNAQGPSLYLIRPEQVSVTVSAEGAAWQEYDLRVRAHFTYNHQRYALKLTDMSAERHFIQLGEGSHHPQGITYFTVSLSEIHERTESAYKLIAAIL